MSSAWSRSSSCVRVLARANCRQILLRNSQPLRHASTQSTTQASGSSNSALVGGIAGGLVTFAAGYGWYRISGAKQVIDSAHTTKQYFESAKQKIAATTPDVKNPSEGLKWLRSQSMAYAAFIPGGNAFVKSAFDDIDTIREKHGDEVDEIVRDTYNEIKQLTDKKGLSVETTWEGWNVLQRQLGKIGDLAGDSASEILDNHPELKKKIGGNLNQLKQMGEKFGPEAKKLVDDTWNQIRDIVKKSGMNIEGTASKLQSLLQEKTEQLKKLGDEVWKKSLKEAKPLLDKNPEIKKLVEENANSLKQGDAAELMAKVKDAVSSGNINDLKDYVNEAVDKANKSNFGSGVDQYLKMVPGASQIIPKLKQFKEVTKEHGEEAEKLVEDTIKEIGDVLEKRMKQAQELSNKAKKNSG
ncbi:hypothetical protein AA313_de0200806 [Arthrobotrys entomopaga]|nr:hypothetical protein AA313_de0200806 [Arthrobotrys entomopaga]